MGSVFQFNKKRTFTLEEAKRILPLVHRITDESSVKVKKLLALLDAIREKGADKSKDLEDEINKVVSDWQTKIEKLGAEGKGLWLVDFDNGTGYYCWKYPEPNVDHYHGYSEGYQSRVKIYSIENPPANLPSEYK